MFLLSLSEVIEEYTMDRAKSDLAKNLSLNVDKVWLVDNENNAREQLNLSERR